MNIWVQRFRNGRYQTHESVIDHVRKKPVKVKVERSVPLDHPADSAIFDFFRQFGGNQKLGWFSMRMKGVDQTVRLEKQQEMLGCDERGHI